MGIGSQDNAKRHLITTDRGWIIDILLSVIIVVIPLVNYNQGLDLCDSTYSLQNFMYFPIKGSMWTLATFGANLVGSIIMRLPCANSIIGMNIYTSLVLGIFGAIIFLILRQYVGRVISFCGIVIAIFYCWSPTTVLYHYLSYYLFDLAALSLIHAVNKDRKRWFVVAGILLGLNVYVRFPNITQIALVIVIWCGGYWYKHNIRKIIQNTIYGICGYVIGIMCGMFAIASIFGIGEYVSMIDSLFSISNTDESYSPISMIRDILLQYLHTMRWLFIFIVIVALGIALFLVCKGRYIFIKKFAFCAMNVLLLRFLWGRGFITFRYYEYSSMYNIGMLTICVVIIALILKVIRSKQESISNRHILLLSLSALIIIICTPLGGNNATYPILNNLFIILPLGIYVSLEWYKRHRINEIIYPIGIAMVTILLVLVFQGGMFHLKYVFGDGALGEIRDTKNMSNTPARGIVTTSIKSDSLDELLVGLRGIDIDEGIIIFGDIPGISYILESPSILSNAWSDLDSYPYESMKWELENVSNRTSGTRYPLIIGNEMYKKVKSGSDRDMLYNKVVLIDELIKDNAYTKIIENNMYMLYY